MFARLLVTPHSWRTRRKICRCGRTQLDEDHLDENLPRSLVKLFHAAGHDTTTVPEEGLSGGVDSLVLGMAPAKGRILITLDRGFADIRKHPPGSHGGIVVFRPADQRLETIEDAAQRLIESGILANIPHGLAIVSRSRIRTRIATQTQEA